MRKVILISSMVAVILALWAVSAFACITQGETGTCTPVNRDHGQSGDHAPPPTVKSHPNSNDNGVNNSPAIIEDAGGGGLRAAPRTPRRKRKSPAARGAFSVPLRGFEPRFPP